MFVMNKHYKIFLSLSLVLIVIFSFKAYRENVSENDVKELSIKYKAKSISDFLISFRKVYQDIFVLEHVKLTDENIDFLPVKTTNEIAELFSLRNVDTKFSTVSDTPRNPVNMANKRQLEIIKNFNKDKKLEYIFRETDGTYYYSQPLYISKVRTPPALAISIIFIGRNSKGAVSDLSSPHPPINRASSKGKIILYIARPFFIDFLYP